jgi:hypothetical protein
VVRFPTITVCIGAGTPNVTLTLAGTASGPNRGGIGLGDAITATLTLVGGAPGTATVTDTTIGRTFTLAAPFQYGSALHISIP